MKHLVAFLFPIAFCLLIAQKTSAQNVNFTATEACLGSGTTFTGIASPDSSIAMWKWDMNNDSIFNDKTGQIVSNLFQQAGTFTVGLKITYTSGSSDSVYKQVIVNPVPEVNFYVNNLCKGDMAKYSDSSKVPGGSIVLWEWDFTNDGIYDDTGSTATYTNSGFVGTYVTKLRCTSNKGCKAFATKSIQVYDRPVAGFNMPSSACQYTVVSFSNTTTLSAGNIAFYSWNFGDSSSSSSTNPAHTYSNAGVFSTTLIAVSDDNCKDTVSKNITITPSPDVTITAVPAQCSGGITVQLTSVTTGGTWSGNGVSSSGVFNPATAGPGVHTVTYTASSGSCSNSDTETIIVNATPNATISPVAPLCVSDSAFQLVAAATGGTWSGTGISSTGVFSPSLAGTGTFTITYTITGSCSASDTETVAVNNPPNATITTIALSYCAGDAPVQLTVSTTGGVWSGTGVFASGVFSPASAGIGQHNVTYKTTLGNCSSSNTKTLTVNAEPTLTMQFSGDTVIYTGQQVTVTATGNAVSYKWSTGATGTTVTFTQSGIYSVTAASAAGCTAVKSATITLKEVNTVELVNEILTPNGDGINDYLLIKDLNAYPNGCALTVYSSWNEEVFSSNNYKNNWDGIGNGRQLDAGAYYYVIRCDGQKDLTGSVSILK